MFITPTFKLYYFNIISKHKLIWFNLIKFNISSLDLSERRFYLTITTKHNI